MRNPDRLRRAPDTADIRARLALVLLCFIWGVTWPLMKIGLVEIPVFSMRTLAAGVAALTLYLVCLVKRRSLRITSAKVWGHIAIASLLNIVGFSVLSAFAQLATATSRVTILAYTLPIWAVLLAWPVLGERPTRMQSIALGLCAVGIGILIYPLAAAGIPLGSLLAIAAGVSWAAGTVYVKWARIEADTMGVASWQMVIAFVIQAACMLVLEGGLDLSTAHADGLLATVTVGFAGGGIAYGLWFSIVQRLSAATASLGVLSVPVIGVVMSILILDEKPTAADIVGFALIFVASACVLFSRDEPLPVPAGEEGGEVSLRSGAPVPRAVPPSRSADRRAGR